MKSRILSIVFSLTIGLGFFSCQKQEDPKPTTPNNAPFRIAKSYKKMGNAGTLAKNDGYTSYVITTSEGYSYTVVFQEVNGYTSIVVTNPGGTSPVDGACIQRIIAILEKWINDSQTIWIDQDNACAVSRSFWNDFRSLRDCVPAEAREGFDEALDEIDSAINEFCQ
ncbi:MAG TPA: hypothetical protein PKY12_05305 [Catalimonadaceae bacterium]|jgi:hypothetical protein|nr:hypothetical protein [Catalimonadaceae bacterium]